MRSLFQKLKKYQDKQEHIRNFKEEEYQDGFLNDIFVDILGYSLKTSSPENFNLVREKKNISDAKKSDGAILKDGDVICSIELKRHKVKIKMLTEQGFIYKNNHPTCNYVITSNFEFIRIYVNSSESFEEFNLFKMGEIEFERFYALFSKEAIFSDYPKRDKERKRLLKVEKDFYKDYSLARIEIFESIIKNGNIDKNIALSKTQKLLDRIIFIFFAENSGLLEMSAKYILNIWKTDIRENSLWENLKILINKVDIGGKIPKTFAYNGGLFSKDEVLDNFEISDESLRKAIDLGFYDFKSDLDVNILGHIFENSLNDLEKMREKFAQDLEIIDTKKNTALRKKDGIFYTPKYIVDEIIESSIGEVCKEKKAILKPQQYFEYLKGIKILDPAVGSGAFLNGVFDYLLKEYQWAISKIENSELLENIELDISIIENNLFGVDLNEEAIQITKLSLWLKTAKPNRKLSSFQKNIKQGNSLYGFDYSQEFGFKFDFVIGNPPYIRMQGLKENEKTETEILERDYISATGNYDIYVLFMEKALKLIKESGKVSFILPHKFLISEFGKGIRNILVEKGAMESLIHFGSEIVFEDASTYTCIVKLSFGNSEVKFVDIKPDELKDLKDVEDSDWNRLSYKNLSYQKWILKNQKIGKLLEKIDKNPLKAKDVFEKIFQGIATSGDKIYLLKKVGKKLYSESLEKSVEIEDGLLKPILKGEDISRYGDLKNRYFVIFPYILKNGKAKPMTESYISDNFPNGYKYLKENEEDLRGRERGKMDKDGWFLYIYPKSLTMFEQEKITTGDIVNYPSMSLDNQNLYHGTTGYSLVKKENLNIDYLSLLGIFNSSLFWFFIKNTSTELRGGYFRIKTKYIEPFALPKLKDIQETEISQKAKSLLDLNKEFQEVKTTFLDEVSDDFGMEKFSKKLQKFYELNLNELLSEIKKATKLKFTKKDDVEFKKKWKSFFEESSIEISNLLKKIKQLEIDVDEIVYKLYNLSENEIKIVEER